MFKYKHILQNRKLVVRLGLALLSFALAIMPLQRSFASITSPFVGSAIYTSGNNINGQMGYGDAQFQTSAAEFQLPSGVTVQQVVQTYSDTLVLGSDGNVWGAGRNAYGELGVGNRNMQRTPVKFQLPAGVSAVSVHAYPRDTYDYEETVFVLGSNGQVYGAGSNYYGDLGYGGPVEIMPTPQRFQLPAGVNALEVSAQQNVVFVRADDGNVYGAGNNAQGELGDGTTSKQATPVVFQLPGGVTAVKLAEYHDFYAHNGFVIGSDGNVYGAGENTYGQLGNGATGQPVNPVMFILPGGVTAVSASINRGYNSVLGSDGQVYGSGFNAYGQLGKGTTGNVSTPVKFILPGVLTATKFYAEPSGSTFHVLASDGQLYGAGDGSWGLLGNGPQGYSPTPARYPIPGGVNVVDVKLIADNILVRGNDGNLYVSGNNSRGQLGTGDTVQQNSPVVFTVPAGLTVTDMATPSRVNGYTVHALASGRVFSSGVNDTAALGNGTRTDSNTPVEMLLPAGVSAKYVFAYRDTVGFTGSTSTCIQSTTDKLYCVGQNNYGQLGSSAQTSIVPTPQKFILPNGVYATSMYMQQNAMYTIGTDGQVYGSGTNTYGQLGDGSTTNRYTPVKFQLPAGVSGIDIVFPNNQAALVLASDGNVYGAGLNSGFQTAGNLGDGTQTNQSTPVKFILPAGVTATRFFRSSHTDIAWPMILGSDGNIYSAGYNSAGQRGVGNTTNPLTTPGKFILPAGLTAIDALAVQNATFVLASDGQVYGAGQNNYGQLGDASQTQRSTPVKFVLPGGLTATAMYADQQHTFVLASDGQLYGSGRNNTGMLGDTTLTLRSTPVRYQLPGGVSIASKNNVFDGQGGWLDVIGSDGKLYLTGLNISTAFNGTQYALFGNGTPSASVSTPTVFPLPGSLTAQKVVVGYNTLDVSVIASDGQIYSSGSNRGGQFGTGNALGSSTPVQYQLPGGETAVDAVNDTYGMFVLTANEDLYAAGCDGFTNSVDEFASGCPGWLGSGTTEVQHTPIKYSLPAGVHVVSFNALLGYNFAILTIPYQGVGGQTFCDGNGNQVQDPGESMLNGQSVSVYQSVGGVASGPALATQQTDTNVGDDGVFFFDGLLPGDYILGLQTDSGMFYSDPVTLDSNGDGWILGNSKFIDSTSAMGQTGFVCGASTVAPPTTSTPGTPGTILAPTGDNLLGSFLIAVGLTFLAMAIATSRETKRRVLGEFTQEVDDLFEWLSSLDGASIAEIANHLGNRSTQDARTWAELSRSGRVDVLANGVIVSR